MIGVVETGDCLDLLLLLTRGRSYPTCLGQEVRHRLVVSFGGENFLDLGGEADSYPQGRLWQCSEEPIVKATASAQP